MSRPMTVYVQNSKDQKKVLKVSWKKLVMSTENEGMEETDFLRIGRKKICHPRFLNPGTEKVE